MSLGHEADSNEKDGCSADGPGILEKVDITHETKTDPLPLEAYCCANENTNDADVCNKNEESSKAPGLEKFSQRTIELDIKSHPVAEQGYSRYGPLSTAGIDDEKIQLQASRSKIYGTETLSMVNDFIAYENKCGKHKPVKHGIFKRIANFIFCNTCIKKDTF
ncbi:hypothetical protein ENBRE01_2323 [Enteropsectra breve]|nr:hypothetical protein ENBRE01_2323 [Enteropsectra breve]